MGGHQSASPGTTIWLTPPVVLAAVGGSESFDLDPCAAPTPRPWATARRMHTRADGDGLAIEWDGRVFLNPPYTAAELARWLERMAGHDQGTALIFARTETAAFQRHVLGAASGLLFIAGRLHFHLPNAPDPGRCEALPHEWYEYRPDAFACAYCGQAKDNAGAPSVLCAYGRDDLDRLAAAELPGAFVPLRFARFALVAGLDLPWSAIMADWVLRQRGPVSVGDAYRYFANHPKARGRRHWRPQVRKQLRAVAVRVGRNAYVPAHG